MRHFRMHLPSDEFDYKNDDRAYSGNEISQIPKAYDESEWWYTVERAVKRLAELGKKD